MNRIAFAALALGCSLVAGCGSKPAGSSQPQAKEGLTEVGQMLKVVADEGKRPPTKPAELEPLEPMISAAVPLIRDGSLVYLWGTPFVAGSEKVAAYEKKVPAEGGYVLLQNGTVKQMTAAEFAAAPKAK